MDQHLNYFYNHINEFNMAQEGRSSKQLRILQWNVRGINDVNKFDEILLAIDQFVYSIDVIIVGETWVKAGNTSLYSINGFNSIFSCRNNSSGGLAMFIKNSIDYKINENVSCDGFHHIHVELMLNGSNIDVHGVYRPPSYDFNLFHDRLENWLNNSCTNRPC